jgi:hypothetical protein
MANYGYYGGSTPESLGPGGSEKSHDNHMQQSAVKGSSKNVKILRWAQGYEFEYAKCFFGIELPRYE